MEEHFVTTSDGYILKMFRILESELKPKSKNDKILNKLYLDKENAINSQETKKKVVFLQHGLLCSSADFVVQGPERSIPYLLMNEGYDVWLGNSRGISNIHLSINKLKTC